MSVTRFKKISTKGVARKWRTSALALLLVGLFSNAATASEALLLEGRSADGVQIPSEAVEDPAHVFLATAKACKDYPASNLQLMEAGTRRVLKTWSCPPSRVAEIPAEKGVTVMTAGVPDKLIQLDATYRTQLQNAVANVLQGAGKACVFVVQQLPGGVVLDVRFSICDLSNIEQGKVRSEFGGAKLPYKGFEAVFSRQLLVIMCDETCHAAAQKDERSAPETYVRRAFPSLRDLKDCSREYVSAIEQIVAQDAEEARRCSNSEGTEYDAACIATQAVFESRQSSLEGERRRCGTKGSPR